MKLLLQITSEVGGVVCTSPFLIGENYLLKSQSVYNTPWSPHLYLNVLTLKQQNKKKHDNRYQKKNVFIEYHEALKAPGMLTDSSVLFALFILNWIIPEEVLIFCISDYSLFN